MLADERIREIACASLLCEAKLPAARITEYGELYLREGVEPGDLSRYLCAIGSFDGLHAGHRELLRSAAEAARAEGLPFVAITFSPDPSEVLSARSPRKLLANDERVRTLAAAAPDAVFAVRFTRELAALTYWEFVERVLGSIGAPAAIHVGADFALGARRAGTVDALSELGRERGFDVFGHELVRIEGAPVTSTRIRGLIETGRLDEANALLERMHFVRADVRLGEDRQIFVARRAVDHAGRECAVSGDGDLDGEIAAADVARKSKRSSVVGEAVCGKRGAIRRTAGEYLSFDFVHFTSSVNNGTPKSASSSTVRQSGSPTTPV